jgi:hypothetical protein
LEVFVFSIFLDANFLVFLFSRISTMQAERRKHVRYIPQENAFAALGQRYSKVGKIKNIGMGGLAFDYIIGQEIPEGNSMVDVFLTDDAFHIHNLPCLIVYDVGVSESRADTRPADMLTIRRCAVRFTARSDEHKSQVRSFIEKHTVGKAEDRFTP